MSKEKEHEAYAGREVQLPVNPGPQTMKNGPSVQTGQQQQYPPQSSQPQQYSPQSSQSQPATLYPDLPQQQQQQPGGYAAAAYPGQTYNTVTPEVPAPVANPIFTTGIWNGVLMDKKSVVEAYLLWIVLGFVGAHHFYLRRPGFGVIYIFTFGLLGCGYVIDMFRMPYLVNRANKEVGQTVEARNKKNISDAYTLWFPFGLIGMHHYYLRNYGQGVLYTLTFGVLGIGWLIDLVRIPSMVKRTNESTTPLDLEKSVATAYVFGITPLGILGVHHFYLNRPIFGLLYLCTFGIFGIGWIVDWFRIPILVKRANKEIMQGPDERKYVDDAYLLWFPLLGFLGLHHFYLRRPLWGFAYMLSLGLFGVGWIVDGFRMACLVKDCNKREKERRKLPIFATASGAVVYKPGTQMAPVSHVSNGAVPPASTSQIPDAQPSQIPDTTGYQAGSGGYNNQGFYPPQQAQGAGQNPPAYDYHNSGAPQMPSYAEQPPPYSPVEKKS